MAKKRRGRPKKELTESEEREFLLKQQSNKVRKEMIAEDLIKPK